MGWSSLMGLVDNLFRYEPIDTTLTIQLNSAFYFVPDVHHALTRKYVCCHPATIDIIIDDRVQER